MVLFWHYLSQALREAIESGPPTAHLLSIGLFTWSGVDLFFVLSGFLIGGILLDTRDAPRYFGVFYARRFFRIIPLYAMLFVVALFLTRGSLVPFYSYATFTQNIWMASSGRFDASFLMPTWSLAIEDQFYLTLPFVVRYAKPKHLVPILAVAALSAPLLRVVFYVWWPHAWITSYVLTPCRADALLLGVLAAVAVRNPTLMSHFAKSHRSFFAALTIGLIGLVVLALAEWNLGSFAMTSFGYSWLAAFYLCVLLYVVVHQDTILGRIMRMKVLVWLGTISYGVYLLHILVLGLCARAWSSFGDIEQSSFYGVLVVCSAFISVLVAASLSWVLFEKRLVEYGRRRYSYRR